MGNKNKALRSGGTNDSSTVEKRVVFHTQFKVHKPASNHVSIIATIGVCLSMSKACRSGTLFLKLLALMRRQRRVFETTTLLAAVFGEVGNTSESTDTLPSDVSEKNESVN